MQIFYYCRVREEARNKKQEARNKKQEARNKKQEARNKKQEARAEINHKEYLQLISTISPLPWRGA